MAKFEFKTQTTALPAETIDATDFTLNTKEGKLTFYDHQNIIVAAYATGPGAYVKKIG